MSGFGESTRVTWDASEAQPGALQRIVEKAKATGADVDPRLLERFGITSGNAAIHPIIDVAIRSALDGAQTTEQPAEHSQSVWAWHDAVVD